MNIHMKRIALAVLATLSVSTQIAVYAQSSPTAEEIFADRKNKKPADGYNTLRVINLITDKLIEGSTGLGAVDKNQSCGTCGSVAVPAGEGIIVLRTWNTTDFSNYLANGEIRFMVKGENGGEDFKIGVQDCNRDRNGETSIAVYKHVTEYVSITNEWQQVKIPFRDFFTCEDKPDITCLWTIRISGANDTVRIGDMRIVSPDKEYAPSSVKVNQLGYIPSGKKRAVVSGYYEQLSCTTKSHFHLVDADSGKPVYEGTLTLLDGYDKKYSGETVYEADFSNFTDAGTYYITVDSPGIENSVRFKISDALYKNLLGTVSKYYYFQRANVSLDEKYAGEFARAALHTEDFTLPFLSDTTKTRDVSGGWFDAGDFGKYVDPASVAILDLLWAYKCFSDVFKDNIADIPESGNGKPDILDEVKVELDFLLKMQDSDGGFYHRANPDDGTRAIVDTFAYGDGGNIKPTGTTANAAAALSFASKAFREYDDVYADKLLASAKSAWNYVSKNKDVKSDGTHGTAQTKSQIFLAACCLYYITGDKKYNVYIHDNYKLYADAYSTTAFGHSNDNMKKLAFATYLASGTAEDEIKKFVREKSRTWNAAILSTARNAWKTPLPEWAFWWGSNANAFNCGMEMYITSKYLGEDTSKGEALSQGMLDFILGMNPTGKSMVTGVGEQCIKRTFSSIFGEDKVASFPAGYTPGGINEYQGEIISRFPAKCYSDTPLDWVCDENGIYYQSALIFATALKADLGSRR